MPVSSVTADRFLHPLHAILLAFPVAFSCAAVASDVTYLNSAVVQWSHFSAWLIAGTELFGGLGLALSIVTALLALLAAFVGHSAVRREVDR